MDWGNPSLRDEAKTRKEEKKEEEEEEKKKERAVVMCRSRRGGGGAGWRQSLAGLVRSCFVELRSSVDGRPPDFRAFVSRSRDRARPMASAIFKSAPLF